MAIPIIPSCVFLVRLRTLDAVIITHSHADAIGGLWNWLVKSCPSIILLFHVFSPVKSCVVSLIESLLLHCFLFCYPGLDDLRDWTNNVQPHIPIYTAMRDLEVYLFYQHSKMFPSSLTMLFQLLNTALHHDMWISGDEEDPLLLGWYECDHTRCCSLRVGV